MNIVYFIQRQTDGAIKIGTTKHFKKRVHNLSKSYGDLKVLGLMEGNWNAEQNIHKQFSIERIGTTEFFSASQRLLDFIRQNALLSADEVKQSQAKYDKVSLKFDVSPDLRKAIIQIADEDRLAMVDVVSLALEQYIAQRRNRRSTARHSIKQAPDTDA